MYRPFPARLMMSVVQAGILAQFTKRTLEHAALTKRAYKPARVSEDKHSRFRDPQNLSVNVEPLPGSEFTRIVPRCRRMIWRERLNPIPDPFGLVVKKGMKILS